MIDSCVGAKEFERMLNPKEIVLAKKHTEKVYSAIQTVFQPDKDPHLIVVDNPISQTTTNYSHILGLADAYGSLERGTEPLIFIKKQISIREQDPEFKKVLKEFIFKHSINGFFTTYCLESSGKGTKKYITKEILGRGGNILGLKTLRDEQDLEILVNAWDIDNPEEIRQLTREHQAKLNQAKTVKAVTGNGKYVLTVDINDFSGDSNTAEFDIESTKKSMGSLGKSKYGNMIWGEAYLQGMGASSRTNGEFEVLLFRGKDGAEYAKHPLIFRFEQGYLTHVSGDNQNLKSFLAERQINETIYTLKKDEVIFSEQLPELIIDEIAMPTNPHARIIPHTMVAEKAGVHFALGNPHRDQIGQGYLAFE
ncbi:MAG: hypothetical protein KKE98_07740 [Nanoarchaeota archaeon]|nr:hypothetical protein [Nanoarchaeota archaeon]MBU1598307.1 hypothetical protein [Nanoarchaeota archaeon]MBU2441795.1 hypothetical protein [Nanoarchaeota archaeon]